MALTLHPPRRAALPALAGAACLCAAGCARSELAAYHSMLQVSVAPIDPAVDDHMLVFGAEPEDSALADASLTNR